jgi:UDP:flavonoid glycosyltransferase YjiC (YdhE family)
VRLYGASRRKNEGTIQFCDLSHLPFLEDLASCKAVISTAGNQLIGEALYFRKPVLVMWEDCVEQRMNAQAVERMQIGMQVHPGRINPLVMQQFLSQLDRIAANTIHHQHDGCTEAMQAIDRYLEGLSSTSLTTRNHQLQRTTGNASIT